MKRTAPRWFPERQQRRPGHPARRRLSRSRGTFRKTPCSARRAHLPENTPLPARSQTCFEGPFGEVIRATGPMAKANPLRFSTKYQDDETDLLYYGYRYYNASTGRWLGRDPSEENGGLNLYAFLRNAPLFAIDALGLDTFLVLYGEDSSTDFQNAAKTRADQLNAMIKARQREKCDKVVLLKTVTFEDLQNALTKNLAIRSVSIFTHGAPQFICLGHNIGNVGGNISQEGGTVKWFIGLTQRSFPWIWPQYIDVKTRSLKELDNRNCLNGGDLDIRGCNTDNVAYAMGQHLFGKPGSGTTDYAYAYVIDGKTYILTKWERFIWRLTFGK